MMILAGIAGTGCHHAGTAAALLHASDLPHEHFGQFVYALSLWTLDEQLGFQIYAWLYSI